MKKKIVPDSSVEDSNTIQQNSSSNKQVSPAKYWCFTLNNYDSSNISKIIDICNNNKIDYIFGEEIGEQGTPHLQGFIRYKTKARPFNTFDNDKIHWEKTKSNFDNNIAYCIKQDKYYTNMKFAKPVKILEPLPIFNKIIEIIDTEPDDRTIYWFWGKQGIGKTQFLKWLYIKKNAMIIEGASKNMKHAIIVYKQENNGALPELLISNLPFECDMNNISYTGYEQVKDMFFSSGKYEGGMVCGNNPHLIILANNPPNTDNEKFVVNEL